MFVKKRDGGRYEPKPRWVGTAWWVAMISLLFAGGMLWMTDGAVEGPLKAAALVACALGSIAGLALMLRGVGEFIRSFTVGRP